VVAALTAGQANETRRGRPRFLGNGWAESGSEGTTSEMAAGWAAPTKQYSDYQFSQKLTKSLHSNVHAVRY